MTAAYAVKDATFSLEVNPLAARFPMLPDEELDRLAEDIKTNGLLAPITLDSEGRILDGRNRHEGCVRAGVEPTYVDFDGTDEAAFVLSQNISRRHMSTGAQAMSTALVLVDAGRRENGRWKRGSVAIGESSNISGWRKQMDQAGQVLDHTPELAGHVIAGTLALDSAFREAETRRDAERQALADQERIQAEDDDAKARLASLAPSYLERIGSDFRTARQAFTAWEDDNRAEAARLRRERADAEKAERDQWNADRDYYSGLIDSAWRLGFVVDRAPEELMARLDPDMLMPNQRRNFTAAVFRDAARTATQIAAWMEENNR